MIRYLNNEEEIWRYTKWWCNPPLPWRGMCQADFFLKFSSHIYLSNYFLQIGVVFSLCQEECRLDWKLLSNTHTHTCFLFRFKLIIFDFWLLFCRPPFDCYYDTHEDFFAYFLSFFFSWFIIILFLYTFFPAMNNPQFIICSAAGWIVVFDLCLFQLSQPPTSETNPLAWIHLCLALRAVCFFFLSSLFSAIFPTTIISNQFTMKYSFPVWYSPPSNRLSPFLLCECCCT